MLTLTGLRDRRSKLGLQPAQMVLLSGITRKRYGQLELHSRGMAEPWFKEACALARVLNCDGIADLFAPGDRPRAHLGQPLPSDRDLFRSGLAMPLSTAWRVAREFGLADPYHLIHQPTALLNQIWDTLAAGERAAGPGTCPWCNQPTVGVTGHLPTCLPNNLWAPRSRDHAPSVSFNAVPRHVGGGFGASSLAYGLARIRGAKGLTQAQMGALIGISGDYYSKLERLSHKLLHVKAELLADKLGIDVTEVFQP